MSSTKQSKPWAPKPEKPITTNSKYKAASDSTSKSQASKSTTQSSDFMSSLSKTISQTYDLTRTSNGALVHSTTNSKILDMNFALSSLRGASNSDILRYWTEAFNEDPLLAMKFLFYSRDCRQGVGEKNIFKVCMKDLAREQPQLVNAMLELFAVYGSWDDIVEMIDSSCSSKAMEIISDQIKQDQHFMNEGASISLAAKWLPSLNATSKTTIARATKLSNYMKISPRCYRKMLSSLRKYLDVVERKTSSNNWQAIDYQKVPSKANLLYKKAFMRHDPERRQAYLNGLASGEAKINASVSMPYEITHKYIYDNYNWRVNTDETLEAMWKALPDYVQGNGNTLVVADGSGSMTTNVSRSSSVNCLDVANSLAIYFAQRCSGPFKDKYITFSSRPQMVTLDKPTLRENLTECRRHNECSNTNIEAVFKMVLTTAVDNHLTQEEIPTILVISDMGFDEGTCTDRTAWGGVPKTLFQSIAKEYSKYGYTLPKMVFWNVAGSNSHKNGIPVTQNDKGVILVSGFSPAIAKMVLSNKTDPYEALVEVLNGNRYYAVEENFKEAIK